MKMKNVEDVYPLSPMQQGMLFHAIYGRNHEQYFMQLSCTVRGPLDPEQFKRAWQKAIERHPILRTSFVWEGLDEPLQVVRDAATLPWEEHDWTDLSPELVDERLHLLLESDRERGFTLSQAPLMRVSLIRIGDDAHRIVWSYHHILLDGWSVAVLLKEVFALYDSFSRGEEITLERPRPYRDYIAWLQQQQDTTAEAFWRSALEGVTAPTALGIDAGNAPSAGDSAKMKESCLILPERLTASLQSLARQQQLTLSSLMNSAWAIALSRYSGSDDILYGMTISGRTTELSGVESMLGLFINTIPFRIEVDEDQELLSWANHLQQRLAEMSHHGHTSLVQIQQWSHAPAGQPLFEYLFVSESHWMSSLLDGLSENLTIENIDEFGRIDYPLTLVVIPGKEILLRAIFDSARIDEASADRLLIHLRTLLERIVADPTSRISGLSMLAYEEQQQLAEQWNSCDSVRLEARPLHTLFEEHAERNGDRIAVTSRRKSVTYSALNEEAELIAGQLVDAGVEPGDVIGIFLDAGIEAISALIGTLKAGAAYYILPANYPEAYIGRMIQGLPVKVCVTDREGAKRLEGYEGKLLLLGERESGGEHAQVASIQVSADYPALLTYSSSRGSMLQHTAIERRIERLRSQMNLADVYYIRPSFAECEGLWDVFIPLTAGGQLVIAPGDGDDFGTYQWRDRQEFYSLIESGEFAVNGLRPAKAIAPVCILDERMRQVPHGIEGELYIGGDGLAIAYLAASDETAASLLPDPFSAVPGSRMFRAGLGARFLREGALELTGSRDKKTWIDGQRIDLAEIEETILKNTAVDECVVLNRQRGGARPHLVAYVVPNRSLNTNLLRTHLEAALPSEMVPGSFVTLAALPLNASGELDKRALEQFAVIDAELAARWENKLLSLPEVEKAVVLIEEQRSSSQPYHQSELLEGVTAEQSRPEQTPAIPSEPVAQSKKEVSKKKALVDGPPLEDQPGNPSLVSEYLSRSALTRPDNGITYIESGGTKAFHSYAALLERAEYILSGLRRAGLKAQDKVVFQFDLNQDFIPAFWGCILGGFIPVPVAVPPTYREGHSVISKLHNAWKILGKPLIITRDALREGLVALGGQLGELDWRVATIEELASGDRDTNWHRGDSEEAVFFQLTSGSTGLPKCVTLTNKNITHHVKSAVQLNKHCADDVSLNWMPMDHVGSLLCYHLRDVFLGCRQVHAQPEAILERPLNWLDWIEQYGVTQIWAPNFAYKLINEEVSKAPGKKWNLSTIRFIMNGGEQVSLEVARAFMNNLSAHGLRRDVMHPTFGMAELSSACIYSHNFDLESGSGAQFLDKNALAGNVTLLGPHDKNAMAFVEVGIPLPGVSFRIADASNQVLPEDSIGRLQLRGDNVMPGYYNNPDANSEVFCGEGWFNTGDLGFVHDGRLVITGREKEIIILNGVNYYNHEIEACLEHIKGVEPTFAAACGVRDSKAEEKLAVFYSPTSDARHDRLNVIRQIRHEITRRIGIKAEYIVPIPKEEFPKTTSGKIQRSQLGKLLEAGRFDSLLEEIDLDSRNASTIPDWFYKKVWRRKKALASRGAATRGCVLIFADTQGPGATLRSKLDGLARNCVSVQAGREFRRVSDSSFEIMPGNQDHYRRLVAAVVASHRYIEDIIHLWSYDEATSTIPGPDWIEEFQTRGVVSVLYLVQALTLLKERDDKTHLFIVSNRSQTVAPDERIDFWKAPVLGLAKTIPLEMPGIVCRHIDLPDGPPEESAGLLLQEIGISGGDQEVAYRQGRRMIARIEKVDLRKEAKVGLPFMRGGAYLITGGLGGIGVELAAYLLKQYDARLILIGKTPLPDRGLWEESLILGGALARRIEAHLRLEKLGGEMHYEAADVCELGAVKEAVERARSRWGSDLDGVIHLAGTYDARPLVEETCASLSEAMRSKLRGTMALNGLITDSPHALFITFSSVNGFWGGARAGAYGAANRFLEAFSEHLRKAGRSRAYCVSWSMWDGVGMSRDYEGKELSRAAGFQPITPEQGLNSFLAVLGRDQRSIIVGLDGDNPYLRRQTESNLYQTEKLSAYLKLKPGSSQPSEFNDLRVSDRCETRSLCAISLVDDIPLTEAGEIDRRKLIAAGAINFSGEDYEPPRTELEAEIAKIMQELLSVPRVGVRDNFFELGGHSLLATQLLSRLRKIFKVNLPLSELFEAPTVAGLAAVLLKNEASPGQVEAITRLRKKIAGMSDEEVRAVLQQKQGLSRRANP